MSENRRLITRKKEENCLINKLMKRTMKRKMTKEKKAIVNLVLIKINRVTRYDKFDGFELFLCK